MKKIYILAVFAVFVHGLFGAAGSSASLARSFATISTFVQSAKKSVPYLDLLLNPEEILKNSGYFGEDGEDYEVTDLINFAQEEKRRLKPARILLLAQVFSSERSIEDFMQKDFASGMYLDDTLALLQACINAPTMFEAIRQLTLGALKRRLKSAGPEILRAYFSPLNPSIEQTKVEEIILWLIRSENKGIKVASYYLTNPMILIELRFAVLRGVDVDIIVNADSPKGKLHEYGIPYKTWKHAFDSKLLMHHKFILFESNIDGDSIVVNGSFNLTDQANRNHENIVVFNNKDLYKQFLRQFNFVNKYAQAAVSYATSDYGSSSDEFYSDDEGISRFEGRRDEMSYQKGLDIAGDLLQRLEHLRYPHALGVSQLTAPLEGSLFDPSSKRPRRN